MSNESRRFFSIVIFAMSAVFAISWGPGASGCVKTRDMKPLEHVATVNGAEIPVRDFARAYSQQLGAMRAQGFPAELAKQFGMHKQVVDSLVTAELLSQAAAARGIVASDEEVRQVLFKQTDFQKDGRFDQETYTRVIRDYEGTTEVAFEEKLRKQLAAQHVLQIVESGVVVSDEEVKAKYLKDGDTAKASFVKFVPTMFADKVLPLKGAELTKYIETHGKELQAFYDTNKMTYFVPEKVKARQILIRVARDASAEKKAEAKAKAENLRKDIVENKKPFAEVAKQFSEDVTTKEKGGELGLVDRLELAPGFADAMFALKVGEVTAAVETPVGYLIGTIEEKTTPSQKNFDEVKTDIAQQLNSRGKSKELARAEAEKALAELKKGKSLAELFAADEKKDDKKKDKNAWVPSVKVELKETGEFNSAADAIPQLGTAPAALKAIFARKDAGLIENLVDAGDGVAIVAVTERKLTSDADFEKQKAQLKVEAIKGKQFEVRESFLKSLKASAQVVQDEAVINKVIGEG